MIQTATYEGLVFCVHTQQALYQIDKIISFLLPANGQQNTKKK